MTDRDAAARAVQPLDVHCRHCRAEPGRDCTDNQGLDYKGDPRAVRYRAPHEDRKAGALSVGYYLYDRGLAPVVTT